jgi:hypothetical protein
MAGFPQYDLRISMKPQQLYRKGATPVFILSFLAFGTTLAASPTSFRAKDADAVRETVFRYQIQHDIDAYTSVFNDNQKFNPQIGKIKQRRLPDTSLRFLARSDKDFWHKGRHGFEQVRGLIYPKIYHRLSLYIIKHLARQYPLVRNYSDMEVSVHKHHARYGANVKEGMGIFYWTEKLHWINSTTVEIEAGSKGNIGGWGDEGPYVEDNYRVVKHGHRWVVQSVEQVAAAG